MYIIRIFIAITVLGTAFAHYPQALASALPWMETVLPERTAPFKRPAAKTALSAKSVQAATAPAFRPWGNMRAHQPGKMFEEVARKNRASSRNGHTSAPLASMVEQNLSNQMGINIATLTGLDQAIESLAAYQKRLAR